MKREQVTKLSELFQIDSKELLVLWLATNLLKVIADEKVLAGEAIKIVLEQIKRN